MENQLYVGVSKEIITPEIGAHLFGYNPFLIAEGIADDLNATAFVLKYDDVVSVMVSADVACIDIPLADRIRKEIEKECNIPFENIMLSATHTHSGPATISYPGVGKADEKYVDNVFIAGIKKAVKDAYESMEPVKVGIAVGESYVGVNRRVILEEENAIFGQCPWAPLDPKMTVVSFRNLDGKTVGNMVHYAAHGTAAGANKEFTRDWPGYMVDRLEYVSGGITGFFNGCEGDIGPRGTTGCTGGKGSIDWAAEVGYIAARDAVDTYKKIGNFVDVDMEVRCGILKLKQQPRISLEEAKSKLEQLEKVESGSLGGHTYDYYEKLVQSYEDGYTEEEYYEVPQTLIRLGNYVFVGMPFEAFAEIGLRINYSCEDKNVLTIAETNGNEGYFGTESAMCHGGYEIESFKANRIQQLEPHADTALVKETLRNIRELKGSQNGGGKGWFNKKL